LIIRSSHYIITSHCVCVCLVNDWSVFQVQTRC